MNRSKLTYVIQIASISGLMAGCAGFDANTESQQRLETVRGVESAPLRLRMEAQRSAARPPSVVEDVERPFVGNNQIMAAKSVQWPAALRRQAKITMAFSDNRADSAGYMVVPINEFAHQIYLATGVPVRVKADAVSDANGKPVFVSMPAAYVGALPDLFDQLAGRHRVFAQYDNGTLEFFRTTTRSFLLSAPMGSTGFDFEATSGAGDSGFSGKTSTVTKGEAMNSSKLLITAIEEMVTKGVKPIYNDGTGTLTITDSPHVLDNIATFLDRQNHLMRRQIVFDIDVIKYTQTNRGETGVDWSIVYQRVKEMSGAAIALTGPAAAINPGASAIGFITKPGTSGDGRFNGSSILVKALNVDGSATVTQHFSGQTTNRTAIVRAFNKAFEYVNETTVATSQTGVAVGQKTKQDNEGRAIMILPSVSSETEAMVDISIRETTKNPFGRNTIGSGATQQTVLLLDKDTDLIRQRLYLRNGETRVVAGLTRTTSQGSHQSLDRNVSAIFGGTAMGNRSDDQYYLVVTMRFAP
jgi:type IVB pilus formation R64 PilN family outer membrane protein